MFTLGCQGRANFLPVTCGKITILPPPVGGAESFHGYTVPALWLGESARPEWAMRSAF